MSGYRTGPIWTPEEDRTLRKLIGKKTAEEIGVILNRPKNGVHHRVKKLNLNGKLTKENHWNAKISNLQAEMIITLHQGGFSVNEIRDAAFNHVSIHTIADLIAARTWK